MELSVGELLSQGRRVQRFRCRDRGHKEWTRRYGSLAIRWAARTRHDPPAKSWVRETGWLLRRGYRNGGEIAAASRSATLPACL